MRSARLSVLFSAILLLVTAERPAAGHGHEHDGHGDGHMAAATAAVTLAPDTEPDRQVDITARDSMTFDPPSITVDQATTVEFVVTNAGQMAHSWSLGTTAGQEAHEKEMGELPMSEMASHMEDAPNGFVLQPGETRTLIWRFPEEGSFIYACHMPGHFAAGMVGEVRVHDDAGHHESDEAGTHSHH